MSWLHALRERVTNLAMRPTQDRELQEEIAHHLELEAARHVAAGVDAHTARQRALARFGDPSAIAEATRRERQSDRFDGIGQDVQWALRTLRRNAGFTALTVGTLTLGIGATITAFTVLDTVLLRPLPYRQPDQLVLIREESKDHATMPPSYPNFADWRARAKSFSGVASAMFPFSVTTWPSLTATEPLRVPMMGVSRHFFATLGVTPFLGREFTDDENVVGGAGDVIMVSYEFWRTQLGGRTPLGSIRVGDDAAKVIGVLPPGFRFISQADLFYPHERGPGTIRSAHNYLV
ncbi:MAG: ABC transporter permease, partial [Gemmatimonadaceae bacterium]